MVHDGTSEAAALFEGQPEITPPCSGDPRPPAAVPVITPAAPPLPTEFQLIIFPRPPLRGAADRGVSPVRASARSASCTPIGMGAIVRLLGVMEQLDREVALLVRRRFVIPQCLDHRQGPARP